MTTTRNQRRTTTAKKTSQTKKPPAKTAAQKKTTATPRKKTAETLPTRTANPDEFITQAQISAAHALAGFGLRLPIRRWTTIGPDQATYHYPHGGHLHWTQDTGITAWTPCARGAHHSHPIQQAADLAAATREAAHCTADHGIADWPEMVLLPHVLALGAGTSPAAIPGPEAAPEPKPAPEPAVEHDADTTHEMDVRALRDALHPDDLAREHLQS